MGKKLYVGNLSYSVNNSDLEKLFAPHGTVQSADVITDRDSGQSKGFGFVEMSTEDEAKTAAADLNGREYQGRSLTVNEAKPKEDRGGSRGGGGSYGGNRGGRSGGGRDRY
jgi:RNA recognition motif-containing protein